MWTPSIISRRARAPEPTGQITETSYPACTSVVASFQTRRSNGTGRFSTMIRIRLSRGEAGANAISPTNAIVLSIEAATVLDADQINNKLVLSYARSDATKFRIAVSDHNDLAVQKCCIKGLDQQRRDVRNHTQQIFPVRTHEL